MRNDYSRCGERGLHVEKIDRKRKRERANKLNEGNQQRKWNGVNKILHVAGNRTFICTVHNNIFPYGNKALRYF